MKSYGYLGNDTKFYRKEHIVKLSLSVEKKLSVKEQNKIFPYTGTYLL